MTSENYLNTVLARYQTNSLSLLPLTSSYRVITPILSRWGNAYINEIKISGSNVKGTAIAGESDLDLFVSLHPHTLNTMTLSEIFASLELLMRQSGYLPRRQNVSIRINHQGTIVDIVPAVKFSGNSNDHWLHITESSRDRTKTNIDVHINRVLNSRRINEIKLTKIWRKINNLDFPSIYLEEIIIRCLSGHTINNTVGNFWHVLGYLSTNFINDRVVDPANISNIISNDLTNAKKNIIKTAAQLSRNQQYWINIIK